MAEATSVITKTRREYLCEITSGKRNSIPSIVQIAFGDGGVDGDGNPIPPSETDTALRHEIQRYDIDGVEYPVSTTARYTVTIPKEDMGGEKISEAALVDADNKLAAIKTMYVKQKDEGVIFVFTFDDEF